ncbi:hypothetical protein A9264_12990 [Vibrio sp. UCD-FRSSP16_10]|uniref:DUF6929 family protein n=1 Tax=unclassified Vibrio TaxID=2614977 RepID=UPI0008025418|nr:MULTISPECIES: hypothetical protein [unclassified Vibrio]OBT15577.1 hypothetical protein A9260_13205 [Vibrio sp. UCD-FRSSP16_30]OBT20649.1 hypothetical protein A9264_12990 [Vibrio sp. UCD-FRSSP16_10]
MKTRNYVTASFLTAIAIAVSGCSQTPAQTESFDFTIANSTINPNLSSGSAMVVNNNKIIVAGDDSPWLFDVADDFSIDNKTLIDNFPVNGDNRIAHATKPDFEAMTQLNYHNQPYYFVVGSGSKKELRENAYLIPVDGGDNIKLSLSQFYADLHSAAGFKDEEKINIEGIANSADETYIFNRGNEGKNAIFKMKTEDMLSYLQGQTNHIPSLDVVEITLPSINGVQACLAGADFWQSNNSLIYTASVEGNNSSSVNDGAIQGSFVGVLPVDALNNQDSLDLTPYSQLIQSGGQPVITKAESIAVDKQNSEQVSGYVVSDNDNGTSQFFTFTIHQPAAL